MNALILAAVLIIAFVGSAMPVSASVVGVHPNGLKKSVTEYVRHNGLAAFLLEYYHLMGVHGLSRDRKKIEITADNHDLAVALWSRQAEVLLEGTHDIRFRPANFHKSRFILGDLFSDAQIWPDLTDAQRFFLSWHFKARRNYDSVLKKDDNIVVGWNTFAESEGAEEYAFYTFGLVACTAVFAIAQDEGAAHFSHYDGVANARQLEKLRDFLLRYPGSRVYVIGEKAIPMARTLATLDPLLPIWVHQKPQTQWKGPALADEIFGYAVRIRQTKDGLDLEHCPKKIAADYMDSIQTRRDGEVWPGYGEYNGRFRTICPEVGCAFTSLRFARYSKRT